MLSYKEFKSICSKNKLFKDLEEGILEKLYKISSRENYDSGRRVFYASEKGFYFYIVESGELVLSLSSGKEKTYSKGDLFGEIAILTNRPRMGEIRAIKQSSLLAFDAEQIFYDHVFPPQMALKIVKKLSNFVVAYLDEEQRHATEVLIRKGEGNKVEFKKSISQTLKIPILKTMCAFFNSKGGTILIGVEDSYVIKGIRVKLEKEIDEYKLDMIKKLGERVGTHFSNYLSFNTDKLGDKIILRINCSPTPFPAIFKEKLFRKNKNALIKKSFFTRSGPSNKNLTDIEQLLSYYNDRFASVPLGTFPTLKH